MIAKMHFYFFIVYRYYSTKGKKKEVAYLTTVGAYSAFLFFNVMAVLRLFNLSQFVPIHTKPRWLGIMEAIMYVGLPSWLIMSQLFKEDDIKKLQYEEAVIKRGNRIVLAYFIISFICFILVGVLEGPMEW